MPQARSKKFVAIAGVILLAILIALIGTEHRARLIAGSFIIIDSIGDLEQPSLQPAILAQPVAIAPCSDRGIALAVSTLTDFTTAHPPLPGDDLPAIDMPDTCLRYLEQGRRLHCYNVDIGVSELLGAGGIQARMWDLDGPWELGGFGHNLLEVYDGPTSTWRVLDPFYHCYFTLGVDTIPLSFSQLRRALLDSTPDLRINRYYHTVPERPDMEIISELRFLAPLAILHVNNDFSWRYEHRYGFLMPLASVIDKFPLRVSRGIRTIMLGSADPRYLVQDRFSPQYPVKTLKFAFCLVLILLLADLLTFLWLIRPSRLRRGNKSAIK